MGSETMKYRDVITYPLNENHLMVTGCDSCGSIGNKVSDTISVDASVVGYVTARVALLEVLTLGAHVVGVTVPISNEPEPTGRQVLEGVKRCMEDFEVEAPVLTSMEKNMETSMTAVGVVVNGIAKSLKQGGACCGDQIFVIGRPSVGEDVIKYGDELLNAESVKSLLKYNGVKELLPVGSKGIGYELRQMMLAHGCEYEIVEEHGLDLDKSCGPSSAAIVIVSGDKSIALNIPVRHIGMVL